MKQIHRKVGLYWWQITSFVWLGSVTKDRKDLENCPGFSQESVNSIPMFGCCWELNTWALLCFQFSASSHLMGRVECGISEHLCGAGISTTIKMRAVAVTRSCLVAHAVSYPQKTEWSISKYLQQSTLLKLEDHGKSRVGLSGLKCPQRTELQGGIGKWR